jgi:hypothetical protein
MDDLDARLLTNDLPDEQVFMLHPIRISDIATKTSSEDQPRQSTMIADGSGWSDMQQLFSSNQVIS